MAKRFSINKGEATDADGQVMAISGSSAKHETICKLFTFLPSGGHDTGVADASASTTSKRFSFVKRESSHGDRKTIATTGSQGGDQEESSDFSSFENDQSEVRSRVFRLPDSFAFDPQWYETPAALPENADFEPLDSKAADAQLVSELAAHQRMVEEAFGLAEENPEAPTYEPFSFSTDPEESTEMQHPASGVDEADEELTLANSDILYVSVSPPSDEEWVDINEPTVGNLEIDQARIVSFARAKATMVHVSRKKAEEFMV